MNCDDIRALLPGWADRDAGGLSDQERRLVASHLETCQECRQALKDLEEASSLVRAVPRIAAPPGVQRRALAIGQRRAEEMQSVTTDAFAPDAAMALGRASPRAAAREEHPMPAQAPPAPAQELVSQPASSRGRRWLIVAIVVAVLAALAYWLVR